MTRPSTRLKGAALLSILLIVGVVAAAYLAYRGTVTDAIAPSVSVSVQSDRAGLVMQRGALVKMNGVEIGTVSQVRPSIRGAVIDLRLRADIAGSVPSDVVATIAATTIFGSKMVTLTAPPAPSAVPIADGAVIAASSVTVEVNSVFESLTSVLVASQPEKLNTTLGALSTALNGRGRALGTTIENLDIVLGAVTPLVPTLRRDLRSAAVTSSALGDSAPDLVSTLASLTTTARTVTDSTDVLGPARTSMTEAATDARTVLAENADGVTATVAALVPTTRLLREYSPEFTCFLQGADVARQAAEKVSGGNGRTMLLNSTVLFGVPAYEYATDLPKVAATGGPRCGALPLLSDSDIPAPYVRADTGSNPFRAGLTAPVLDPASIIDFLPGGLAAPSTTR